MNEAITYISTWSFGQNKWWVGWWCYSGNTQRVCKIEIVLRTTLSTLITRTGYLHSFMSLVSIISTSSMVPDFGTFFASLK